MRVFLAIALTIWAGSAIAQSSEDDRDWITGLIEDAISNDNMVVRLDNFQGALSSQATADAITLADGDGVWLRLDQLTLTWNRSALLSGRVDIENLSAERIELIRLPLPAPAEINAPSAEATPFQIPELPVSIDIQAVSANEIVLTEALLGEPISASFSGALTIADGSATTNFLLERTDGKTARFDVNAAFDNSTRQLSLFLLAEEDANGIAARLIDLPDRPALRLEVSGDAPLDDFAAQIALATAGEDRVTGTVRLSSPDGSQDRNFSVDLSGDMRPLLADQYDDFFGTNTVVKVDGTQFAAGGLSLSNLVLAAEQIVLRGKAEFDPQGWPMNVDLRGRLASGSGDRVLLPVGGAPMEVSGVSLNVQYDVDAGEAWTAAFDVTSFGRAGINIDALTLSGGGTLTPGAGDARGRITADLNYAARGLDLNDPALNDAIGSDITGVLSLARLEGEPFVIRSLTLDGAGIEAAANAIVKGPDDRFWTRTQLTVSAADFSRFSALAGQPLEGSGQIEIGGDIQPFDGIFDVYLDAQTNDLALGIAQIDPLLDGATTLAFAVDRDTTGTRLRNVDLRGEALQAKGRATITGDTATAVFSAAINNLGLIDPSLSGPATVQVNVATDPDGVINMNTRASAPDVTASFQGSATPENGSYILSGDATAGLDDLGTYAALTGRPLGGSVNAQLSGSYSTGTGAFDVVVDGQTDDLTLGIEQADALLAGNTTLSLEADRSGTQTRLRRVVVNGDAVEVNGEATMIGETATADLTARINDFALLEPNLSGPATLRADVSTDANGIITLDSTLSAPDANASAQGTASPITSGYLLSGTATAGVNNLAAYGDLIGQPLGGGVNATATGTFNTATTALSTQISARTQDIRIGTPIVDRILAGLGRIDANVGLSEAGRLQLDALNVVFPNLTVDGAVATSGNDTTANLSVRLRDIALLVSDFSGPVTADVSASQDASGWQVAGAAQGPVNTSARVTGRVENSGTLNLNVTGDAPLALANVYISPRQVSGLATFDLSINGPPALSSVRGPVRISDGRLSVPTLRESLENLNGTLLLAGGTARLDFAGNSVAGGDLSLSGPVDLSPPFQAGLTLALNDIVLRDPTLYRTTVRGDVTVNGPLAGGARIAGTLNLGQADVQVPSTGVSALGSLPAVTHLGVPTDVRATLSRAEVGVSAPPPAAAATGPDYPVDLTVRAPDRIFVRGRGLDAELGGQLRLTGSTSNIIPVGRFDLVRGRLDILGQRFDLDEGFAQLQGDFQPFLRLVATTQSRGGTDISIIVEGPADAIEVRFESTPQLPQDEVLAQLLFGRDLSSISPLQAVQLASAVATLAGTGGGGVINNIRENLSLDDFDLTTDAEGNAAVRAGKYLSDNVYSDVTIGANGTSEINLNLEIDRNFTARGSVASDGETSVGIFFERDY